MRGGPKVARPAPAPIPTQLLLGLATRLSALGLLVMTAVIQVLVYPAAYATHGVWAAVLLWLMARGPGVVSVDHWRQLRRTAGQRHGLHDRWAVEPDMSHTTEPHDRATPQSDATQKRSQPRTRIRRLTAPTPPTPPAPTSSPSPVAARGAPARAQWQADVDAATPSTWVLQLAGDWRLPPRRSARAAAADRIRRRRSKVGALPPLPAGADVRAVHIDTSALQAWDADLGPALWPLLAPLQQSGATLDLGALPDDTRVALEMALGAPPQVVVEHEEPGNAIDRIGLWAQRWWDDALDTVSFIGEVLLALRRTLRPRHLRVLRGVDFWRQFESTGPLSLPIVTLTSFLVGLLLAYMGGAQLTRVGGQAFIADIVTVGVVRELAGLMTGVILAGRIGAAFAAQLATMQANEEIDALRTLGIDPVEHLVLPRLLAMLAMAPLLVAYAAVVGVLAGLPAASGIYGVPVTDYLQRSLMALSWTHVWIGLGKGTMYVLLVALAGCREGLHAGRNAQAVGDAATRAVVKALVWIVLAASASTALLQILEL